MSRPGEETGDGVPRQMVDPAFLSELSHDGVDPGEACGGVRPLGERVVVVVPRDLGKILFILRLFLCFLLDVVPR